MEKKIIDHYNVTDVGLPSEIGCTVQHLMLPMRDGVKLHTMVFFPPEFSGRAPVLLMRTPYTQKTAFGLPSETALKHRLVFICQACRGTGWSQGLFDPTERNQERDDAEDLLVWLKTQPWFNGRCVMTGASYVGWTQWEAARIGDPALVGLSPQVSAIYSVISAARPGGAIALAFTENWMLSMHHRCTYGYDGVPNYQAMKIFEHLPIQEADIAAGYRELPPLRKFYAAARRPAEVLQQHRPEFCHFTIPAFISGGWFDLLKIETIESFQLMQSSAATPEARNFTRLTIGPWVHGGLINPDLFGEKNDYRDLYRKQEKFLCALLRSPKRDPLPGESAVRYYLLGENNWHEADSWPPAGVTAKKWYLHSDRGANSLTGDGTISPSLPGEEPPDSLLSNPKEPVLSDNGGEPNLGCYDRTPMEKRADVLVFTTKNFTVPLTLTGAIKLNFTAAASTLDTDFVAVLTDVTPDGRSLYLTCGILRARYRRTLEQEELLTPGKFYDFELTLSDIAASFLPGHAMRLEICGQHYPIWARNANTGKDPMTDRELKISRLTILHNSAHPAVLTLPVLNGQNGEQDCETLPLGAVEPIKEAR